MPKVGVARKLYAKKITKGILSFEAKKKLDATSNTIWQNLQCIHQKKHNK